MHFSGKSVHLKCFLHDCEIFSAVDDGDTTSLIFRVAFGSLGCLTDDSITSQMECMRLDMFCRVGISRSYTHTHTHTHTPVKCIPEADVVRMTQRPPTQISLPLNIYIFKSCMHFISTVADLQV